MKSVTSFFGHCLFGLLTVLIAASCKSTSASAQQPGVKIIQFGLYAVGGEVQVHAPGIQTGGTYATRHLVQQRDCIAAERGQRFGIVLGHNARDGKLQVPVRVVLRHPSMTFPDGQVKTSDTWDKAVVSEGVYTGWRFDHPYEMVPGTWTFLVEQNGKVVAQKKFTVVTDYSRCPGA